MFRNVTFGQYYPADSILHKLDPRCKLMGVFVFIISVFVFGNIASFFLISLFLVTAIILSRVPVSFMLRGMRPVLFILIITVFFNLIFTPGMEVFAVGILHFTDRGIISACRMFVRLSYLVVGTSILTLTTTPNSLTDGMESLFSPLSRVKVPVHEIALMMSIALRFIPILSEEAVKIMRAQESRGADFTSGNIIKRTKNMVPLLVPLFVSAFRRADELSLAMEARGYRGGKRTRLNPLRTGKREVIGYIILAAYLAGVILAGRYVHLGDIIF